MTYRSKALRDTARGAPCTLELLGCDGGGETSVWAHSDEIAHGKGRGSKASDAMGCIACGPCHSQLPALNRHERVDVMRDAILRTHAYLWERGIVGVIGVVQGRDPKPPKLAKVLPRLTEYRR